jgi:hypothetical protein
LEIEKDKLKETPDFISEIRAHIYAGQKRQGAQFFLTCCSAARIYSWRKKY